MTPEVSSYKSDPQFRNKLADLYAKIFTIRPAASGGAQAGPAGKFQIQFQGNKCAAVKGGVNADMTAVEMVPCSDADPNQQWTYDAAVQRIRWATQPGKVLDVSSYANLTPVVIYTDNGGNQKWKIESDGTIANVGRPDVVLDVRDGQSILQVYQKVANAPNQKFSVKSLTPAPAPVMAASSMPPPPANPMVPAPPPMSAGAVSMGGTPAPVPASPSSAAPVIVLPASTGPGTYLLRPTS